MPRYIDADALTAEFKRLTLGENSLIERIFADGVYAVIDTFPAADVVPKREVDKTIAEWAYLHADTLNKLENSKAEVAREIFEEIEKLHLHITNEFDLRRYEELKKKYTNN